MKPSLPDGLPGEIRLTVRHNVPSLNRLFAMNPWQRKKEKEKTQAAFMSALQVSGLGSAILTTFARNTSSTASATRGLSGMIARKTSRLK